MRAGHIALHMVPKSAGIPVSANGGLLQQLIEGLFRWIVHQGISNKLGVLGIAALFD